MIRAVVQCHNQNGKSTGCTDFYRLYKRLYLNIFQKYLSKKGTLSEIYL